jgi:hypothetical protein
MTYPSPGCCQHPSSGSSHRHNSGSQTPTALECKREAWLYSHTSMSAKRREIEDSLHSGKPKKGAREVSGKSKTRPLSSPSSQLRSSISTHGLHMHPCIEPAKRKRKMCDRKNFPAPRRPVGRTQSSVIEIRQAVKRVLLPADGQLLVQMLERIRHGVIWTDGWVRFGGSGSCICAGGGKTRT